jgi:hypothetical protein
VVHSLLANDVRGRLLRKAYVRAANSVSLPALSRYWLIKSRRKIRGSKRRCDCNETFSPHAVIITMSRMVRKREQSFTPHVIAPMICVLSFVLIVVFFLSRMRMRRSLLLLIFFFHFCVVLRSPPFSGRSLFRSLILYTHELSPYSQLPLPFSQLPYFLVDCSLFIGRQAVSKYCIICWKLLADL